MEFLDLRFGCHYMARRATSYCGIRTCNGAGECARDHGPNDGPAHVRYLPLSNYLAVVRPA